MSLTLTATVILTRGDFLFDQYLGWAEEAKGTAGLVSIRDNYRALIAPVRKLLFPRLAARIWSPYPPVDMQPLEEYRTMPPRSLV